MKKWYYYKRADITIGEKQIKNYALYVLLILIFAISGIGLIGYQYRVELYDYVVNPSIVLTQKEVTVEVGEKVDLTKYFVKGNDRVEVDIPEPPNTDKLGEYTVEYVSRNKVRENKTELKIKVVDTTAPTITLTQDSVVLTRDVDTQTFNAKNYIASVKDNYDKDEDIKVEYPTSFDFSKDSIECTYTATDKSGNTSTKTLVIAVKDKPVEIEKPVEQPSYTQPSYTEPSYNQPSQPSYNSSPSTDIVGVHPISVPVGTDFGTISGMLTSGVSSGYNIHVDYSSVNTTVAGTYTVTFTNTAGTSVSTTVTIY